MLGVTKQRREKGRKKEGGEKRIKIGKTGKRKEERERGERNARVTEKVRNKKEKEKGARAKVRFIWKENFEDERKTGKRRTMKTK